MQGLHKLSACKTQPTMTSQQQARNQCLSLAHALRFADTPELAKTCSPLPALATCTECWSCLFSV